jgi:hypothetical protein
MYEKFYQMKIANALIEEQEFSDGSDHETE